MKSKLTTLVVMLGTLAAAGALLGRVAAPAWAATRAKQPVLQLDSSMAAAGQGVTLALLGGFRALVGDGVWIRMYSVWEHRDLPAVETLLRLVTAIDPRPVYFWINSARIIAYDFPAWRIAEAGGNAISAETAGRIRHEQAMQGLEQLDVATRLFPQNSDLWVERANIQSNVLKDYLAAAESYRRAWEQPNGPYYAARLHAEMLRRAGHKAEALAWLIQLYPKLPRDSDAAAADVVLERIRDLERELGVPAARAYQPPR